MEDVRQLMGVFKLELEYSMLFLRHVETIKLAEVNDDGILTSVAHACKVRDELEEGPGSATELTLIETQIIGAAASNPVLITWFLFHGYGKRNEAAQEIRHILKKDFTKSLKMNKLSPKVSLAIPICGGGEKIAVSSSLVGRLFTVLPLHVVTGLPLHIHGMFALSPDRDSLKGDHASNADAE